MSDSADTEAVGGGITSGRLVAPDWPIRQRSANGLPKPFNSIVRRCARCSACFLGLAPGKTGERGIWTEGLFWYCSQECLDG